VLFVVLSQDFSITIAAVLICISSLRLLSFRKPHQKKPLYPIALAILDAI
jgi:hypothetical protein